MHLDKFQKFKNTDLTCDLTQSVRFATFIYFYFYLCDLRRIALGQKGVYLFVKILASFGIR
jgi:hypothetical protein